MLPGNQFPKMLSYRVCFNRERARMEQGFCSRTKLKGGTLLWSPGQEDPEALFARDSDEGRRAPAAQALPSNFQFVRALDPLRNFFDLHSSPTEIAIHELPRSDSLRSVRSIVSNCHTVHLQIGQVRGLGSHLPPGRQQIYFK